MLFLLSLYCSYPLSLFLSLCLCLLSSLFSSAVIDCGDLTQPDNGFVSLSGTVFASTATYSCVFGYRLDGPNVRFCTDSGVWLPEPPPTCSSKEIIVCPGQLPILIRASFYLSLVIDCMDPGTPANGMRELPSTTLGAVVTYTCNPNYELKGDENRTCEEDGWSGGLPTCSGLSAITCIT